MINWLSSSFFYVYIIHSNPTVRIHLYNWLKIEDYIFSELFVLHMFLCAVVLFVTCILIDIVFRRILIYKSIDTLVGLSDQYAHRIINLIDKICLKKKN